jgi:hypothetical protein
MGEASPTLCAEPVAGISTELVYFFPSFAQPQRSATPPTNLALLGAVPIGSAAIVDELFELVGGPCGSLLAALACAVVAIAAIISDPSAIDKVASFFFTQTALHGELVAVSAKMFTLISRRQFRIMEACCGCVKVRYRQ